MVDNDEVEIEVMRLAGSVGTRCTSSADEVDRGPLAANTIGIKLVASGHCILEKVMMVARLTGINCATGEVQSREVSVKKASLEETSIEQMSFLLDTVHAEAGWWVFKCKSQTMTKVTEKAMMVRTSEIDCNLKYENRASVRSSQYH